jgi:hypothetical protein
VLSAILFLSTASTNADLLDGLVGYWPFDRNGNDFSGDERHLELFGGVGFGEGRFGQALDLHNNGLQYAQRPVDDAVFDFGAEDFTIQAWINFNALPSLREQTIVEKLWGNSHIGWSLTAPGEDGNQWQFYSYPSGQIRIAGPPPVINQWHYLLVRRADAVIDVIIDGLISTQQSSVVESSDARLLIGRRDARDSRNFAVDGRIDDVAIWNRTLSDTEIDYLFNRGNGNPVIKTDEFFGDYDASGQIEQRDLDLVLLNWGTPAVPPPDGWFASLPTGTIDQDELDGVLLNWGASMVGQVSSVPEPATKAIVALLLLSMILGRVRHWTSNVRSVPHC